MALGEEGSVGVGTFLLWGQVVLLLLQVRGLELFLQLVRCQVRFVKGRVLVT